MVVFGLDFGTTFSTVSVLVGNSVALLRQSNSYYIPTCVFYLSSADEVLYGFDAEFALSNNQSGCFFKDLKRWVGCTSHNVESYKSKLKPGYDIDFVSFGSGSQLCLRLSPYKGDVSFKVVLPMLIASFVKCIISDAERAFSVACTGVVCSVPAGYNTLQRAFMEQCVSLSGYSCVYILNEPSAAALSCYSKLTKQDECLLVYDFGGGTFDVSVVSVNVPTFVVRGSAGDMMLGGRDVDRALSDKLKQIAKVTKAEELDVSVLKEALSKQNNPVRFSVTKDDGTEETVNVTRMILMEVSLPFIQRTIKIIDEAKSRAGVKSGVNTKLVIVGGSSYLPGLVDMLKSSSGVNGVLDVSDARAAVSYGCAMYSLCLEGASSLLMVDCVTHNISVPDFCARSIVIVPAASPVPFVGERMITLRGVRPTSTYSCRLFEGDHENCIFNELIYSAEISMSSIGVGLRSNTSIDVKFITKVDSKGKISFYVSGPSAVEVPVGGSSHYDFSKLSSPSRRVVRSSDYDINSAYLSLALTLTEHNRKEFVSKYKTDFSGDLIQTSPFETYSKKYTTITKDVIDATKSRLGLVVPKLLRGSDVGYLPL